MAGLWLAVWLGIARAEDCKTPQESAEQFQIHMQSAPSDPDAASVCFDLPPEMKLSPREFAIKLQQLLDARGLVLAVEDAPPDPAYKDGDGRTLYRPFTDRPEIQIEKVGDRWVWSRHGLRAAVRLHGETFHGLSGWIQRILPADVGDRSLGPVKVWQIVGFGLMFALAALIAGAVNFVLHERIRSYARSRGLPMHEDLFQRTEKWLVLLAIGYTIRYAVPELMLQAQISSWLLLGARVVIFVSGVSILWRWFELLSRIALDRAAKREIKGADQLVPMGKRLAQAAVILFGGMWFFRHLGVDVDGMLAGLGIGGLALALGAQETLANLFASLMIFLDAPFQVGDWVLIDGYEAKIEEIGIRSTRLRTLRDTIVVLPNARIAGSAIENLSERRARLVKTTVGLPCDTPPKTVTAFLEGVRAVLKANPKLKTSLADATLLNFGASSLDIAILFFVDTTSAKVEADTRTQVFLDILRMSQKLGVSMAFPSTSVYVEKTPDRPLPPPEPVSPQQLAALLEWIGTGAKNQGESAEPSGRGRTGL